MKPVLLCRLLLGGLFLVAGLLKLGDPQALALTIFKYHCLPLQWIGIAAAILPWVEAISATALLCGVWVDGAALVLGGLNLGFGMAVASVLWRRMDVNCGCFRGTAYITYGHLLLNLVVAVLVAKILLHPASSEIVGSKLPPELADHGR